MQTSKCGSVKKRQIWGMVTTWPDLTNQSMYSIRSNPKAGLVFIKSLHKVVHTPFPIATINMKRMLLNKIVFFKRLNCSYFQGMWHFWPMNFTKDSTVLIFRDWRSPGHRLREARDKKLTLMVDRLIWTNIICNLDKYYKQFLQISSAIWTNMNSSLDKYNLQFGQI